MTKKLQKRLIFAVIFVMGSYVSLGTIDWRPEITLKDPPRTAQEVVSGPAGNAVAGLGAALDKNDAGDGAGAPPPYEDRQMRPPFESVDFNYSSSAELLQAAMDDYFDIKTGELIEAEDANVKQIRDAFKTEQIHEIDSSVTSFLRDNSISRAQKVVSLFKVMQETEEWGPRKGYLLDTLAELRPIEIVAQLEVEYQRCVSDECRGAFVSILSKTAELDEIGQGHLSEQQIEFIRGKQAHMESLLKNEVTKGLNSNEPDKAMAVLSNDSAVLSPKAIVDILETTTQDGKTHEQVAQPYLTAVIGSVPIDMDSLDKALAMVKAQKDPSKKDMLLGTIESALNNIPLEDAPREKLQAFLKQEYK
jgi:F0F1-type ATP synthase delta subunit